MVRYLTVLAFIGNLPALTGHRRKYKSPISFVFGHPMKHDKDSAVIFLWSKLYATEATDGTTMPPAKPRNYITSDIASYGRRSFEPIQSFPNNSTGKTR